MKQRRRLVRVMTQMTCWIWSSLLFVCICQLFRPVLSVVQTRALSRKNPPRQLVMCRIKFKGSKTR